MASEQMSFETVDGRMTNAWLYCKLTYKSLAQTELKIELINLVFIVPNFNMKMVGKLRVSTSNSTDNQYFVF